LGEPPSGGDEGIIGGGARLEQRKKGHYDSRVTKKGHNLNNGGGSKKNKRDRKYWASGKRTGNHKKSQLHPLTTKGRSRLARDIYYQVTITEKATKQNVRN